MTWLYVLRVRLISECPSVSITTRAGTPWASRSDAHACRRSWKRWWGRPAPVRMCWKRRGIVIPSSGVPWGVPKTRVATPVGHERIAHEGRQRHDPPARDGLRFDEFQPAVDPGEGVADGEAATLKLDGG